LILIFDQNPIFFDLVLFLQSALKNSFFIISFQFAFFTSIFNYQVDLI
jgi:hypothetical protein